MAENFIKKAISTRNSRVELLQDVYDRMVRVMEARAAHETMQKAPGGDTGLLVRQLKKIGHGEDAEIVEEFALDTGLLKEMREHARQAAQELGQWEANKGDGGEAKEIPAFRIEIVGSVSQPKEGEPAPPAPSVNEIGESE